MKKFDATEILAKGYTTKLDLGDAGSFTIDEIEFRDTGALARGTWDHDGKEKAGELDIRLVEYGGNMIEPTELTHIFNGAWEDWTVEEEA